MRFESALVLFSGGQDSATCLAFALENFTHVETLGFSYGQRHIIELEQRPILLSKIADLNPKWKKCLGQDHLLNLDILGKISDTALTKEREIYIQENGLPNTFVPGRNLIFLNFAASLAYRRGLRNIIIGVCETDYSGYPDCRDDTIKAMQVAINLGLEERFIIHTPLMFKDKAATWQLAYELGGEELVNIILEESHSCYKGERNIRHIWGYGCGECPACKLRANGFEKFKG